MKLIINNISELRKVIEPFMDEAELKTFHSAGISFEYHPQSLHCDAFIFIGPVNYRKCYDKKPDNKSMQESKESS